MPGAETATPFPAAAFFGAMLDDKLDVDAGPRTSLNSGAPYLARQMSWCENQGTGGSYLLGSFDIGASRVQLSRSSLGANRKLMITNTLGFTQVRAASRVTPYSCLLISYSDLCAQVMV